MAKYLIKQYQDASDWRIKENSNQSYSYPGQNGYVISHINAQYALEDLLPEEGCKAHKEGYIHIHDLSGLCDYCMGIDLEMFLMKGLHDLDGGPLHFTTALSQLSNAIYLISQEIAGAIAFNSVDVLLAPYAYNDGLTYKQIKQAIQEFTYTICVKGRVGHQSPFTNLSLDITVPKRLKGRLVRIGSEYMPYTYDDPNLEWYIEAINRAFLEVLMESKRILPFPVLNIGITKDFDWDNKLAETIFTAAGRIGQPTFNNYVSGLYDPDNVKSMCCSLRIDMRQLVKNGGQFGSLDSSGSIGVVTLDLPRYGYLARNDAQNYELNGKEVLFTMIDKYMDIARDALLAKRKYVEEQHAKGMYPTVKRFISDFRTFFNTIGVIGMNELCLNFMGKSIDTPEGVALSMEILEHMNNRLADYQEQTADWYDGNGLFWNLELVPGEGCTHRFAKHDKERFPDIITANGTEGLYYTRGCWLPADQDYSMMYSAQHQEDLQNMFTGGANWQWHTEGQILDWKATRSVVKKLIYNTKLPFISISPTISVCPICGQRTDGAAWCEHELTEDEVAELKAKGVEVQDVA